jgi:hypothetical protein
MKNFFFKNNILVFTLVVFGFLFINGNRAGAAVDSKTSGQSESQKAKTKEILKNISIVGFYNMTDKSSFEGSNANGSFSGEMNTTNSYGVGLESKFKTLNNGIIVKGGANFEFGRTMNKASGLQGNQKFNNNFENPKPELSEWVLYLQGELPVTEELGIIGGGNFNFPTIKNAPGSYSGKLGWQAGISYLASENFYIDGMWRSLNYNGTVDNVTYDNINIAGFILRGRITFE